MCGRWSPLQASHRILISVRVLKHCGVTEIEKYGFSHHKALCVNVKLGADHPAAVGWLVKTSAPPGVAMCPLSARHLSDVCMRV